MKGKKLLLAVLMLASLCGCEVARRGYQFATKQVVRIPTENMSPTIKPGDLAVIDKSYYATNPIKRFDLIMFKNREMNNPSESKDTFYLKRVIALGGETVEIHKGKLLVNGSELMQPFATMPHDPEEEFGPLTVPQGEYFILGDHRTNSADSRFWKKPTLDKSHIIAKVIEILPQ